MSEQKYHHLMLSGYARQTDYGRWLFAVVRAGEKKNKPINKRAALVMGAERYQCSTETIRRYLDVLTECQNCQFEWRTVAGSKVLKIKENRFEDFPQ